MKKECDINAFTCYIPSRSLKWNVLHPIKYIKAVCRGFRAAWQRATKGFCDYDLWDLDSWLLQVLPDALDAFVKDNPSYPAWGEMDTFEKWQNFLKNIASDLRDCADIDGNSHNEYYEEYIKKFDDPNWNINSPSTELDKKYFARCKEIAEEQQIKMENAFARLAKWLHAIWW